MRIQSIWPKALHPNWRQIKQTSQVDVDQTSGQGESWEEKVYRLQIDFYQFQGKENNNQSFFLSRRDILAQLFLCVEKMNITIRSVSSA